MKTYVRQFLTDTVLMLCGSALIALAINGFLRPHEFLSGGMAGTSLIVYYNWQGIPFASLYLILNIPVFALGYFVVGRKFILYSVWAVLIHASMFHFIAPDIYIPDKLLSALIAGVLSGTGTALILRTNGTCSGTEIISIIVNKFYSVNLSVTNMLMNALLLLVASFFLPVGSILYSFVFIVMQAQAMNAVFKGLAKRKAVMIISKKWKEILRELHAKKKIGATLLSAKGGYTGSEDPLLYSIVKSSHVSILRSIATRIDPAAFIVIMETTDIINDTIGNQPPWKKSLYSVKK
jgi:uncharacterized membrane-anchored protein YitT (DUF2179 family)